MNREKLFHPLAALHLLRKTLLVYLLPLVQVLFARNWEALRAALRQDLVLLVLISLVCWAVYYGGRWQVDAEGTVHVSWRLGVRLDRALRAEGLAALVLEQPLLYRLTGACRVVLYPVGQTKTITLYLTRQQAEKLADVLLPVTDPLWHAPKGGEKLAFTVLGANGLSTLFLWWLAIHQTQSYAPDAQTAALAQLGQLAALAARWLPLGAAWLLVGQGGLSLCAAAVESGIRIKEQRRPSEEGSGLKTWWADVKEAIQYLRREKGLMNIYGYMAVTNGVGSGYSPILVAFFRTFPGMTATMYSLLSLAEFLGRSLGGMVQYRTEIPEKKKYGFAFLVYMLYETVDLFLLWLPYPLMLVSRGLCGFLGINSATMRQAAVQRYIPDRLRARVNAFESMLYTGAAAVLSLAIGALGEVLDYRLCVSLCGGFSMAVCLATIWRGRKYVRAVYERSGE